ncbi:hypothetical protein [Pseudomonas sp. PNPG3]|uniref:hypothetical protein n=1 Tax=Pseudomonas sp. PNPG3 TaxID=2919497 RepID=UPI001FFC9B21|nr:hypothetical protein [Pseudomonas sp. PNPG3]MCK2122167.1 hypothetical protein [Pseudomonas sp. PNPG3]
MSALEQSTRRELVFTASPQSWERIDQVMALQGHDKYSLTVARGFALVQWVLEQQAAGRTIGAMAVGGDFLPLEERPELLAPRPRMQVVQDSPPVAAPTTAEPDQATALAPAEATAEPAPDSPLGALKRLESSAARKEQGQADDTAPKGPTNAQLKKPRKFVVPARREKVDNRPTGTGQSPIRTLEAERAECLARNEKFPIEHQGKPLPANLDHSCLQYLLDGLQVADASHFRVIGPSHVGIYGHFPKKDWCVYDPISRKWRPDVQAREGFAKLYSIELAIDYLQRQPAPDPAPEDLEEVTY